jgi:hypothetical protein
MKGLEKHVLEMGLFFYLVAPNEQQAESLTQKTINRLRDSNLLEISNEVERDAKLFALAVQMFNKSQRAPGWLKATVQKTLPFLAQHSIELGPWKQFQRRARVEDLVTVALVGVIGLDPIVAANAQGVSEGTLKYRMARGLKQLSPLLTLDRGVNGNA